MGRPKMYTDGAEKQRAYRARRSERTLEVDRPALESMENRLRRLRDAVSAAGAAGDVVALQIDTFTLEDTLDGLTALFLRIAAAPMRSRPAVNPVQPSVQPGADRASVAAAVKSVPGANTSKYPARKGGRRR